MKNTHELVQRKGKRKCKRKECRIVHFLATLRVNVACICVSVARVNQVLRKRKKRKTDAVEVFCPKWRTSHDSLAFA